MVSRIGVDVHDQGLRNVRSMDTAAIVTYLGHATTLLEVDGVRILTDPLLRRRTAHLRRPAISHCEQYTEGIDAVLISHMHWDHLDVPSLRMLPASTPVYAPVGSRELLLRAGLRDVSESQPGDRFAAGAVSLEITPANHDGFRPPFGPYGDSIGFLIHGSRTYYFAGDTDLFPEMTGLTDSLDVALLPVWGWGPTLGAGHLDPARAASALTRLRPQLAVPIHWGTLCPIGLKWTRPRFLVDPPLDFERAALDVAPDVTVRVVQPGSRLDIQRILQD